MDWSALLWAGFVATTLGLAVAWVFRNFELTELSPAGQVGSFLFSDPRLPVAEGVGLLLIFSLGSLLFPVVYTLLFGLLGEVSWGTGALLGLLHGILAVALLPVAARASASVRHGRIPPPGPLGLAWGRGMPAGVVLGHMVYGGALGASLAAFAAPPG